MKLKNIFIVNFIVCFFLFVGCEYFLWHKEVKKHNLSFFIPYSVNPVSFYEKAIKDLIVFRPVIKNASFHKRPIVLFGCSYSYGVHLNDDETFSYKLQNYTKRVVYNKAMSCFSVQNMLYFLQNGIEKEVNNPEFIVYTFMQDHVRRLYVDCLLGIPCALFYKYKDAEKLELVEKNNFELLYWHSYLARKSKSFLYEKNILASKIEREKFLYAHFVEANKKIKEIYPNTKFVIFVYDGEFQILPILDLLIGSGIEVIFLKELTSVNMKDAPYIIDDIGHPSPVAWDVIVPLFSKKLNL